MLKEARAEFVRMIEIVEELQTSKNDDMMETYGYRLEHSTAYETNIHFKDYSPSTTRIQHEIRPRKKDNARQFDIATIKKRMLEHSFIGICTREEWHEILVATASDKELGLGITTDIVSVVERRTIKSIDGRKNPNYIENLNSYENKIFVGMLDKQAAMLFKMNLGV